MRFGRRREALSLGREPLAQGEIKGHSFADRKAFHSYVRQQLEAELSNEPELVEALATALITLPRRQRLRLKLLGLGITVAAGVLFFPLLLGRHLWHRLVSLQG